MAKKKSAKTSSRTGLKIFAIFMALVLVAAVFGGLQLWGKGKVKPSNWFKNEELAPVTISLDDKAAKEITFAAFGNAPAAASVKDSPSLMASADWYPVTKTVTASCTLPDGVPTYQWDITSICGMNGGDSVSVNPINADGSSAQVTATCYFYDIGVLTARAYLNGELRGIGSVRVHANHTYDDSFEYSEPTEWATFSMSLIAFYDDVYRTMDYQYRLENFIRRMQDFGVEEIEYVEASDYSYPNNNMDITVIFDWNGRIVRNYDYLPGFEYGKFFVIDTAPYAADEVMQYGGAYLIAPEPDYFLFEEMLDEISLNVGGGVLKILRQDPYYLFNGEEQASYYYGFRDCIEPPHKYEDFSGITLGSINQITDSLGNYADSYSPNMIWVLDSASFQAAIDAQNSPYSSSFDPRNYFWFIADYQSPNNYDAEECLFEQLGPDAHALAYQYVLQPGAIFDHFVKAANDEDIIGVFDDAYLCNPILI